MSISEGDWDTKQYYECFLLSSKQEIMNMELI